MTVWNIRQYTNCTYDAFCIADKCRFMVAPKHFLIEHNSCGICKRCRRLSPPRLLHRADLQPLLLCSQFSLQNEMNELWRLNKYLFIIHTSKTTPLASTQFYKPPLSRYIGWVRASSRSSCSLPTKQCLMRFIWRTFSIDARWDIGFKQYLTLGRIVKLKSLPTISIDHQSARTSFAWIDIVHACFFIRLARQITP